MLCWGFSRPGVEVLRTFQGKGGKGWFRFVLCICKFCGMGEIVGRICWDIYMYMVRPIHVFTNLAYLKSIC